MMPIIEVCVYCSHKIEEKEKSVNLAVGVVHLACALKETTRTQASAKAKSPTASQ
jgi:replication-associated recombination protein RarA